jgi:F420-non-reducing hydrogenase large subunit
LNRIEMAFRAYDPCFGCATHALPGQMPLLVHIYDCQGKLVRVLSQNVDGADVEQARSQSEEAR